jgi:hypothetical protein
LPLIVRIAGLTAEKETAFVVLFTPLMFAKIEMPLTATVKPPPTAADVPPPTNDAVTDPFVISAATTFWSMVIVKLLE